MSQDILNELVKGILEILGSSVECIILYGSVARGTNTVDSDVDVALLLNVELSHEREDALSDFIVDMNLRYDKVFSVIDIDYENFREWETVLPFYRNVRQEGIVLWKAA